MFERKNKYIVIKRKSLQYLSQEQLDALTDILETLSDLTNYVVVKEGYPEYEMVWKAIEERVTKNASTV